MAELNIVQGLVRGKLGEGFGDPYNNKTYYKVLNTRKLVEDKIRDALIAKYGFIGGVTMRTINMIYNMYMASNCKTMDEKNFWSAVNQTMKITDMDVRNLAKVAYKYTDLRLTSVQTTSGGTSARISIKNEIKKKANKTNSLILFCYSVTGKCIGQAYSAADNAVWNEAKKYFEVPKSEKKRWQKVRGGEFGFDEEMEVEIPLIEPVENEMYAVAYNVEVGNYNWTFTNGTEVELKDGETIPIL